MLKYSPQQWMASHFSAQVDIAIILAADRDEAQKHQVS
jgi:hypothetical protein